MTELRVVRSELILGGQKSGKTARAESLAAAWLAEAPEHRAVYIATAQAWDEEMRERIARHQRDRAERVPRMATVEEPVELARAIGQHSRADTLIVVGPNASISNPSFCSSAERALSTSPADAATSRRSGTSSSCDSMVPAVSRCITRSNRTRSCATC